MDFIDLEALGRYVKQCQLKMKSLTQELETCRQRVKDRDDQIRELQAVLIRQGLVTFKGGNCSKISRRFPR